MNILNKLTVKHLTMNKKRTIVTIIGVLLSTALMVGIGLLFSTLRDNAIQSIIEYNGKHHVEYRDVEYSKLELVKENEDIKEYFYYNKIGYAYLEGSKNEYKPYLLVVGASDNLFEELNLIEGRFPSNSNEIVISEHIFTNGKVEYKVGDKLNLKVGYIKTNNIESDNYEDIEISDDVLIEEIEKKYTITGIVKRSSLEDYSSPGYYVFTKEENKSNINLLVVYKKPAKTYEISESFEKDLGIDKRDVFLNDALLGMYGASGYTNIVTTIGGIMTIVLTLISIGCVIVIYNSFAISVMERKKQFGLFSSIGATSKQIRKTVFFEAFIIGIIGISLGILSSFLGIGTVLLIINDLLKDAFDMPLRLSVYPLFILIPLIFMVVVIIISAYLPAKMASRISPIDAIRQNTDIKIKGKKVRTSKLIRSIFGVEGDISLKNIKRNKKKYRITVISLVVSIVLFVSFSSFIQYIIEPANDYMGVPEYDIDVYYDYFEGASDYAENLIKVSDKGSYYLTYMKATSDIHFKDPDREDSKDNDVMYPLIFMVLTDEDYNQYLKQVNGKEMKPILYNYYVKMDYSNNQRKYLEIKKYDKIVSFNICEYSYDETTDKMIEDCYSKIDDYYLTDVKLDNMNYYYTTYPTFVVNKQLIENYKYPNSSNNMSVSLMLYAKDTTNVVKLLDQYQNGDLSDKNFYYNNVSENLKMQKNIILVVKILVYGFIGLTTLIGVTSVFNTINTNIALRRKEFAMLRSVGLTPKGFNKMLFLESLFFGLKSLLYGLILSMLVVFLIFKSVSDVTDIGFIIPWRYIIYAIIGVFVIILSTMFYSTSKIKHENIIDTIREENI